MVKGFSASASTLRVILPESSAPFDFVERVHAEVEEERPFQQHPRRLIRTRQNLRRLLDDDGGRIAFVDYLLGRI